MECNVCLFWVLWIINFFFIALSYFAESSATWQQYIWAILLNFRPPGKSAFELFCWIFGHLATVLLSYFADSSATWQQCIWAILLNFRPPGNSALSYFSEFSATWQQYIWDILLNFRPPGNSAFKLFCWVFGHLATVHLSYFAEFSATWQQCTGGVAKQYK